MPQSVRWALSTRTGARVRDEPDRPPAVFPPPTVRSATPFDDVRRAIGFELALRRHAVRQFSVAADRSICAADLSVSAAKIQIRKNRPAPSLMKELSAADKARGGRGR